MIPTVVRWFLLLVLLLPCTRAETLDDAVRALAKKVASRLTQGEQPRITAHNISSLAAPEADRASNILARALRRPAPRATQPVEIAFTISENLLGFLLIAEIRRAGDRIVEMTAYRPPPAAQLHTVLTKRVIWEQEDPILDLSILGDSMLVLDTVRIALYARRQAAWELEASQPIARPAVRDPRGRIEAEDGPLTLHLPGITCRGAWKPSLAVDCEASSSGFTLAGETARFTAGRNTLESEGWPPFYSHARVDGRSLRAGLDGRARLYDAASKPVAAFEGWGSDIVSLDGLCGSRAAVLVTAAGDQENADSAALYLLADRKPMETGNRLEFPGPVTLWPAAGGALAIARNLSTDKYAAYSISFDCSP